MQDRLDFYERVLKFAEQRNNGWVPDFSNDGEKKYHIVTCPFEGDRYYVLYTGVVKSLNSVYFKNREDAQELADTLNDEFLQRFRKTGNKIHEG